MAIANNPVKVPLANQVVHLSIVTTQSEGVNTVITVELRAFGTLSVAASQYITDNNLEPEIFSKAGVTGISTVALLTDVGNVVSGDYTIYTVTVTLD